MEYIRYTERRPITRPFKPTDEEHALYQEVSGFLQREDSYALPKRQRHLTALILRKLLASSSQAIAATLDKLRARLETLGNEQESSYPEFAEQLIEDEEIEDDLLDEILAEGEDTEQPEEAPVGIDRQKLPASSIGSPHGREPSASTPRARHCSKRWRSASNKWPRRTPRARR